MRIRARGRGRMRPLAIWHMIEKEIHRKDEHVTRDETKPIVPDFFSVNLSPLWSGQCPKSVACFFFANDLNEGVGSKTSNDIVLRSPIRIEICI